MPDEENVADVTEENEEEVAVAPEEDEVVAASPGVESESDSGSGVDAESDEADEEEEEAPQTFAGPQDSIQATFVAGAQALAERKKAERAERLATEQPPRRKPQFVR